MMRHERQGCCEVGWCAAGCCAAGCCAAGCCAAKPHALRAVPLAGCGVLIAWLGSLGCSGPKLTPEIEPSATGSAIIEVKPPPGGICGPAQGPSLEQIVVSPQPAAPETCPSPPDQPLGARADVFSPVRPMGVGYPGAINALPQRVAYLTFDDGPSEWTHTFLDILRDKGVKATFFVTAKQLKGQEGLDATYEDEDGKEVVFRDVLKREVDEGHQIANHTVNHIDLAHVTRQQITSEIDENELLVNRALVNAGGKPELLTLFRPPYGSPWFSGIAGHSDPQSSERISSHGLNIMWTVTSGDASDWAAGETYSSTITPTPTEGAPSLEIKKQRVKQAVVAAPATLTGEGMVVLMHDTHSATRDVLPDMIDQLRNQGYTFETIEHYVQWRWNRPSLDLTPGPNLYQSCIPDRDWGCEALGDAPLGTDRATEVCGRFWVAYHAFGGAEELGVPLGAPTRSADTGIVSQAFELATIELHPENPPPCNIIQFRR